MRNLHTINVLSRTAGGESGSLVVRGKQEGETILSVTDNVTGEQANLNIKVVDSYLTFNVGESTHSLIPANSFLVLVKDSLHTFYLYDKNMEKQQQGTYSWALSDGRPTITLTANHSVYPFSLTAEGEFFWLMYRFLDISWETIDTTIINEDAVVQLQEVGTCIDKRNVNLV